AKAAGENTRCEEADDDERVIVAGDVRTRYRNQVCDEVIRDDRRQSCELVERERQRIADRHQVTDAKERAEDADDPPRVLNPNGDGAHGCPPSTRRPWSARTSASTSRNGARRSSTHVNLDLVSPIRSNNAPICARVVTVRTSP